MKSAYDEFSDEADQKAVLEYAKNRVEGSTLINNAAIDSFDEFKKIVNQCLKPSKCLRAIEREVEFLKQGKDENVDKFAKRTIELNEEYAEAFTAERFARNRDTDPEDLEEL